MSNQELNELFLIVAEDKNGKWLRKDAGGIKRYLNDAYKNVRDNYRGVREKLNPGRWISEKVFSGFAEQMENLREVDDQIQNWTHDLDNCLDKAEQAKSEGRPLDVVFWLSQINNRLNLVSNKSKELHNLQDDDLAEFYSDSEHGVQDDYFTSGEGKLVEAGLLDGLGRKITNWKMQQMYRKKLDAQNKAIDKLLSFATSLVDKVENRLGIMSVARGKGDIARYMAAISDISTSQAVFEKTFRGIYASHFSKLTEALKRREVQLKEESAQEPTQEKIPETMNEQIPVTVDDAVPATMNQAPSPEAFEQFKTPEQSSTTESKFDMYPEQPVTNPGSQGVSPLKDEYDPSLILDVSPQYSETPSGEVQGPIQEIPVEVSKPKAVKTKTKKKTEDAPPATSRSGEVDQMINKKNHLMFYKQLEKAAKQENPHLLAMMMSKYSEMIEEIDPETSDELLTLAETIVSNV